MCCFLAQALGKTSRQRWKRHRRMKIVEWRIKSQRPQVYRRTGKEITHRTQMANRKWETFSFKGELGASSVGGLCLRTQTGRWWTNSHLSLGVCTKVCVTYIWVRAVWCTCRCGVWRPSGTFLDGSPPRSLSTLLSETRSLTKALAHGFG